MVRVEESITIDRPVEEVFTYLSNIERQPEWVSSLQGSSKESQEPTAVGTRYRQQSKILGRKIDLNNEITAFEPPQVYEFHSTSGPMQMTMRFTMTAEGTGTHVLQVVEGESGGFFKLADPLLARTLRKQLEADLETLKVMLESGAAAQPVGS